MDGKGWEILFPGLAKELGCEQETSVHPLHLSPP